MKKIYTLVAMTLMAVAAYALPANLRNIQPVKLSDDAVARSQMRLNQLVSDIENCREVPGLEKHDVEIDGLQYTAYFLSHGPATRVANDWEWADRLYDIDFIISSRDAEVSEYYVMSVLWPTRTIISLLKDGEENMVIDNTMVPPEEMIAMNDDFVPFKFIYYQPGYVNVAAFDNEYVIGWCAYSAGGKTKNEAIAGVDKGATLSVAAFDLKTKTEDITMNMDILDTAYSSEHENNVIGNININYNGDVWWPEPPYEHREFTINEVHIAYTGIYHGANESKGIESNWPYYEQYFPSMKRYYINMCNENMTYDLSQWHDTTYPYYHASKALGLGKENNPRAITDDEDAFLTFVQGSLWTPVDKNTFYYLDYTQVPSEIEHPGIFNVPEYYTTQEAWANALEFAIRDGMTGAYDSRYTDWYDVKLSIGGVEGIVFEAKDSYHNTYEAKMTTGEIYYHYDPEDMSNYVMMPVTRAQDIESILTDNTFVRAADGVIKVSCEGTQHVQIFNLSGAMVSGGMADGAAEFAVSPGAYIVKVGSTSHKVIL